MQPAARVIADSISPDGARLTSLEVVMHRFVLAEFNTHRVFSRNSASSRAIPVSKRLTQVRTDPAFPISWPSEKPGMQGGEPLSELDEMCCREIWGSAALEAANRAEQLAEIGLHKSVTSRLLEPFLWHTVLVTSTEWDNFYEQRCSPLAQPELRAAAEAMRIEMALAASVPDEVNYDEWHTPYLDGEEKDYVVAEHGWDYACKISTARSARTSYETQDGVRDQAKDLNLYTRLEDPGEGPPHASPFEHVATPSLDECELCGWGEGNFEGWRQLRHEVLGF